MGSGVAVVSNLGNLNKSLGGSGTAKDLLATLFSVHNAAGRLGFGYVMDRLGHRFPRAAFLCVAATLMACTQLFLALSTQAMLYAAIVLLGIAYGGLFCILPTMCSEYFGLRRFGTFWGVLAVAPALGSVVFGTLVAGMSFTNRAHRDDNGKLVCSGEHCFRSSLFVNFFACCLACLFALLSLRRAISARARWASQVDRALFVENGEGVCPASPGSPRPAE